MAKKTITGGGLGVDKSASEDEIKKGVSKDSH